jgi:hypothetical protein
MIEGLGSKRIYDFQKLELIEISIPSADSTNTVLSNENRRVRRAAGYQRYVVTLE